VSLGDFGTSLQILSKNMLEASRGSGAAKDAFDTLGISVTDSGGKLKTAEQVMLEVADKFSKMEDGAQKTALAMEIMGRNGAAMIPMLNQGAKALAAQRKEAELFGATFNAFQAKAAEDFNDTLTRIGTAVRGFTTMVSNYLLPLVNEVLDAVLGKLKEFAESGQLRIWAVQTAEAIVRGFLWAAEAIATVARAAPPVIDGFRTIMAALQALNAGFNIVVGAILTGFQTWIAAAARVAEALGLPIATSLRLAEASVKEWATTFFIASRQAADAAVAWGNAIGTTNAGAEAFAQRLDGMAKSFEAWAGRALAASIKAAAGLDQTGKAATTAGGRWEILEFQVDGVTKSLRVWTAEVSKTLPKAVEASLAATIGAPAAGKPAAPGTMAGVLAAAATFPEEGAERALTPEERGVKFAGDWEQTLRDLASLNRRDLLGQLMQKFGPTGNLEEAFAGGALGSPADGMAAATRAGVDAAYGVLDAGVAKMEARVTRGIEFVNQRLPQAIEQWFTRKLFDESSRGIR